MEDFDKEEQVVLVDEENNVLGYMGKQEAHIKALLHRAISVIIFNSKGEQLIQQRAFSKYHFAGIWSNTCCSHPRKDESFQHAAERRLFEELGIKTPLKEEFNFIYKVHDEKSRLTEWEYDTVFTGVFDGEFEFNKDEVAAVRWIKQDELEKEIQRNPEQFSFWFKTILEELKKKKNCIDMHLLSHEIENYIEQFSSKEDNVLSELARETYLKIQMPQMVSGNMQGQFLEMFSQMLQPKRILEIGTFTGYSAICLANGLAGDGLLYTIDVNEELQPMCARYFEKANLSHKIKHLIGDAQKIIPELNESFDLVFIDADKVNYANYYDLIFDKVRIGGFIIADNVLWSGKVLEEKKDKDTLAIHQYNQKVSSDNRVKNFILPLRDGLNIVQKLR